jgi:predicted HicB family RNase H-like nuclease
MNEVKVFPLRFSADFHKKLTELAKKSNKSLHQYIIEVLELKVMNNGDYKN